MAIDLDPGNVIQWAKEGRIYSGFTGTLTTPEAAGATTLVRQTPIFYIRVPAGTVIVPLQSIFCIEAAGGAALEVLVSTANNDPGTSNSVAVTAVNVNSRYALVGSRVTAYGTNSGNTGTAPTGVADLYRFYNQADFDAITGAPTPPIIYNPFNGAGSPAVIGSTSAVTAYMTYAACATSGTWFTLHHWAEFKYDEFYAA
jgi:hypothetical protein